ncbi:MAG: right-handed parallel beta-helix repeat-containing protein [Calditrichaceae bacterium]|nr:right-handed parallel beta-helix repeat-containing protein [Calditrichaceae bacterium]
MKQFSAILLIALLATGFYVPLSAQTYYVDYEAGSDSSDGLSANTAWKHCPGDENAVSTPSAVQLEPGATVLFKGGVIYRGSITMKFSGDSLAPIIYKGDGWGDEKAILDGSEPMTGWRPCASEAEGGENWQNCYITFVPSGLSAFTTRLAENGEFLWMSQEPDQPDPFFFDATAYFISVPQEQQTTTSLIDSNRFNQTDPAYWDGSHLLLWVLPNITEMRAIIDYIPDEYKVTFDTTNDPTGYNKYSIYNSIHAIDQPGEYFFDERPEPDETHKIVLYPRNSSNITNDKITCYSKNYGINISDKYFITIEGFLIRHYAGSGLRDAIGIGSYTAAHLTKTGITVRNNIITHNAHATGGYGGVYLSYCNNSKIENNQIIENMKMDGIFCPNNNNLIISGNTLRKIGGTCLCLFGGKDCRVFNNTISEGHGTHDNGMTFYLGCERVLVYNNRVTDYNITLTFNESKDLFFVNNIFDGSNNTSKVIAAWGGSAPYDQSTGMIGQATFINNTIIGSDNHYSVSLSPNNRYSVDPGGDSLTYRMINNIFDGGGWSSVNSYQFHRSHNLYVGLGWNQQPPDWSPAEGEIVDWTGSDYEAVPIEDVFVNPAEENYYLKSDSRAVNNGVDPSAYFPSEMFPGFNLNLDRRGAIRPYDSEWDIGAYEYDGSTGITTEKLIPDQFSLSQNFPNPFNPITNIEFQISNTKFVTLKIFDLLGREVVTLVKKTMPAGKHTAQWNGKNLKGIRVPSGTYFYQIQSGDGKANSKKMILVR